MHFEHYNTVNDFITDCKLIFGNCALFNDVSIYLLLGFFLLGIPSTNTLTSHILLQQCRIHRLYLGRLASDDIQSPKALKASRSSIGICHL
jgi:hypothetical protein